MPKTILIVEDDRALAKSLVRTVEENGYACEVAYDGVSALEQVKAQAPDLVLLDLLLPKKDGRAVLAALQASGATSEIPVIAMSGVFRGRKTGHELQEAGAQGFLEKPFRTPDLMAHLHALIGPAEEAPAAGAAGAAGVAATDAEAASGDAVSLETRPVAEVIWQAMDARFSGALQFRKAKVHKVVVLSEGVPRQVRSNSAKECLGRRFLAAGRIDEAALHESLARARAGAGRQGEILVELGAVTPEEVEAELNTQVEDKLLDLFAWEEGTAWQQAGVQQMSYASDVEGWTPHRVILRGVTRMRPGFVRELLACHARSKVVATDASLSVEERELPRVAEALDAIGTGTSVQSLLGPHAPMVYGLWVIGAARIVDPSTGSEVIRDAEDAPARDLSGPLGELLELKRELEAKDYFEMLEVGRDATSREIRDSFLKCAKRYHPDRFRTDDEAARSASSEIFALLSTAHETLADNGQRREYAQRLESGRTTEDDRRAVEQIVNAEQEFQKGEAFFKQRSYAEALARFKVAIEMQPEEGEFQAYYGYTYFLQNRDEDRAKRVSTDHLKKAAGLSPTSATAYYFLGLVYKSCGDEIPAIKMFRKVLDLQPTHAEASRELRLFQMRKSRGGKSAGGIFGFGRKK